MNSYPAAVGVVDIVELEQDFEASDESEEKDIDWTSKKVFAGREIEQSKTSPVTSSHSAVVLV